MRNLQETHITCFGGFQACDLQKRVEEGISGAQCARRICNCFGEWGNLMVRGPAEILFISRTTCSDSIAKLFSVFMGHRTLIARCVAKWHMGYRTDVPV